MGKAQRTINEVMLPTLAGTSISVWNGGIEYQIRALDSRTWEVGRRDHRGVRDLIEFRAIDSDHFVVSGEQSNSQQPVEDWRDIVRSVM